MGKFAFGLLVLLNAITKLQYRYIIFHICFEVDERMGARSVRGKRLDFASLVFGCLTLEKNIMAV